MAARMQQRRGTASQWTSANPVLGSGEIGFETDTNKFKIGNGQATWGSLPYFANVSDIIDGAPDLLNTLNELAAALGDDPNAITTIQSDISDLQSDKADLSYVNQEISDLNTAAQGYADTAESNAEAYTNALIGDVTVTGVGGNTVTARIAEAIADIVSSSPETLDALNELAAALGNDPNFATTVSTEIGTKVSKSGDTMSGLLTLSADPTLNFHAATKGYVDGEVSSLLSTVQTADGNLSTSIDTLNNDVDGLSSQVQTLSNDLTDGISTLSTQIDNEIQTLSDDLSGDINNLSTQVEGIATDVGNLQTDLGDLTSDVQTKAPLESPSFTGTAVLPTTTSIGDVSSSEIGHLNGVTSAIQTQIDAKLDSGVASGTYAPLNGPTFGGTVSLPSTTSIGDVSNTEISYLNGVTSSVQTQLTDLDTSKAPKESPTFTGTVSGVTKTHVGLSNVDNTSDANKPVSTATQAELDLKANLSGPTFTGTVSLPSTTSIGDVSATEIEHLNGVTSGIQSQIDSKLNLSGGTLTGALTLSGAPTSDLHAATKLYVDGLAAGINFHQPVVAATSGNLDGIYNNGTNGFGATLTKASNGSIGTIDNATVAVGNRILLRAQTDPKENGIYTITALGSGSTPWQITRATDADNNPSGELLTGDFCFVTSGATNGSKGFILNTTGTITIGTTEISYSQFNASEAVIAGAGLSKSGETLSIATGGITTAMLAAGAVVDIDVAADAAIAQSKIANLTSDLNAKAPIASPTFTGTVTVAASGIAFADGTQTMEGVPSRTVILQRTASNTLSGIERDDLIEMNSTSPMTLTIPLDSTFNFPIGTSIDVLQTSTGQVTIAGVSGVTVNSTPGLKLRTQWSSATLFKRAANTWVVYGDLTA